MVEEEEFFFRWLLGGAINERASGGVVNLRKDGFGYKRQPAKQDAGRAGLDLSTRSGKMMAAAAGSGPQRCVC